MPLPLPYSVLLRVGMESLLHSVQKLLRPACMPVPGEVERKALVWRSFWGEHLPGSGNESAAHVQQGSALHLDWPASDGEEPDHGAFPPSPDAADQAAVPGCTAHADRALPLPHFCPDLGEGSPAGGRWKRQKDGPAPGPAQRCRTRGDRVVRPPHPCPASDRAAPAP